MNSRDALIIYTCEDGFAREKNVFYALNIALRKWSPDAHLWKDYLYYLMHALKKLPKYSGMVYRGGNGG